MIKFDTLLTIPRPYIKNNKGFIFFLNQSNKVLNHLYKLSFYLYKYYEFIMLLRLLASKHLVKRHTSSTGQEPKEEILDKRETSNEAEQDT